MPRLRPSPGLLPDPRQELLRYPKNPYITNRQRCFFLCRFCVIIVWVMKMECELPKRKSTRLTDFDYSMTGAYFLTVCTENRRNILSAIVGEGSPLPQLSQYGKIVDMWIQKIPEKYPEISVDCYVIMPNHIHLLLSVMKENGRGDPSPTVKAVMGWLKYQATKEINKLRHAAGEKFFNDLSTIISFVTPMIIKRSIPIYTKIHCAGNWINYIRKDKV